MANNELVAVLVDEAVADALIAAGVAIPMPATCHCGGHMTTFETTQPSGYVTPTKTDRALPVITTCNVRACDRCERVEVLL